MLQVSGRYRRDRYNLCLVIQKATENPKVVWFCYFYSTGIFLSTESLNLFKRKFNLYRTVAIVFITFCDRNPKLLCFFSIIVAKC